MPTPEARRAIAKSRRRSTTWPPAPRGPRPATATDRKPDLAGSACAIRLCGAWPQAASGIRQRMNTTISSTTTIPIEDLKQWCGQDVLDPSGDKLGKLDQLYWDTEIDAPAFAAVKSGTFGKHVTLVALGGASAGQSYLRVTVDKSTFKKAPHFDPEAELTAEDEMSAYEYYGREYRPAGAGARRLAKH